MQGGRRLHVGFLLTWLQHSKLVAVVLLCTDTNARREETTCRIPAWLLHYKLVAVVLLSRDNNVRREETTCRIPANMVAAL